MPRNMISANHAIFAALDAYCVNRGVAVANAGTARWIATEPTDRKLLKEGHLNSWTSFSISRRLARIDHDNRSLFCTVGLTNVAAPPGFSEIDLNGAILTLLLYELSQQSIVSPLQVKNIVEVSDKASDPTYAGHDFDSIGSLFPIVKVYEKLDVASEETWKVFFLLCLSENRGAHSWMNDHLNNVLESLCVLDIANIPFDTLCRSVFDSDPAALFLALYRCMEAVYAYSSASSLKARLSAPQSWSEIAAILEDELNWHPREESSLTDLMQYALEIDLTRVYEALGEEVPETPSLAQSAGRRIYRLRNILVHYRPTNSRLDYSKVDWNKLCAAMASVVCDMYVGVFAN